MHWNEAPRLWILQTVPIVGLIVSLIMPMNYRNFLVIWPVMYCIVQSVYGSMIIVAVARQL